MDLKNALMNALDAAGDFVGGLLNRNAIVGEALGLIGGFLKRLVNVKMNDEDVARVEALDKELGELIDAKNAELVGLERVRLALRMAVDASGDGGQNVTLDESLKLGRLLRDQAVHAAASTDELVDVAARIRDLTK